MGCCESKPKYAQTDALPPPKIAKLWISEDRPPRFDKTNGYYSTYAGNHL